MVNMIRRKLLLSVTTLFSLFLSLSYPYICELVVQRINSTYLINYAWIVVVIFCVFIALLVADYILCRSGIKSGYKMVYMAIGFIGLLGLLFFDTTHFIKHPHMLLWYLGYNMLMFFNIREREKSKRE